MSRPPRWLVATLALGLPVLGVAGAWFYVAQRQYLQHTVSTNLLAAAQDRMDRIVAWRAERLGDAAVLQESPFLVRAVERWLAGHQPELGADILTRLRSTKDHLGYDGLLLVDQAGRVLLATNGRQGRLDPDEAEALRAAFRDRRPTISDVHVSSDDSIPHLSVVAPLFASTGRVAEPIGAVVHAVDARHSLVHLVASWASPSPSTEILIVRRDGDSVELLSAPPFRLGPASLRRISLSRTNVPAVMAVLGTEGVVRGMDYRGVRVISALRAVPGTPWFLVAKVDEAEALAVWRTQAGLVFGLFLGLMLAAAATAIAIAQRVAKAHYRSLYEAEAALGASEARFRTLVEEAGDGFALLDAEGRYLDVNSACCRQLGYARQELLLLRISDVDSLFSAQRFAVDFQSLVDKPPVTYHSNHRRKDGTTFPVEVTLSIVRIGGVPQALSLARDITERKRAEEALREREQELSILFEELPVGVSLLDRNRKITYANPRLAEILGLSRDDLLQGKHQERRYLRSDGTPMPPEEFASVRAFREQRPVDAVETGIVVEDGTTIWTSVSAAPFPEANTGVLIVTADISERRRAHEALRESEVRHRTILATALDGFWLADMQGRLLEVNEAYSRMSGYGRQELLAMRISDLEATETRAETAAHIEKIGTHGADRFESRHRRKDGSVFDVDISVQFQPLEGGRLVVFVRDITERRRAEEALRESEERHRSIIEQLNDVYYRTDRDGCITMMSPSAAHLFGFPSTGEMIGRPIESLWQDPSQRAALLAAIRERGFVHDYETTAVRTDGTPFAVAVSSHFVRDASGAADGVEGIIRDITERKQSEEALRTLAKHLDAVREEEHTRMAREIHDEFGQALTALRLDLTWLARRLPLESEALRRKVADDVALVDETIAAGKRIVEELRPPILDDLGLVAAVEWYAQAFARRSGLRVELEAEPTDLPVAFDLAVPAYRIVQEALTNVARHAKATRATVRLGVREGVLTIEISDDGRGIRVAESRNPQSVGIVGMRERAASRGGTVRIEGGPGRGTSVLAVFPLEQREPSRDPA